MRAQRRVTFGDVLDQIREQQIDVAKLADDDPLKPVWRSRPLRDFRVRRRS
jgi:hypothetical protein